MKFPVLALSGLLTALLGSAAICQAESEPADSAKTLLIQCAGCHTPGEDGSLSRISEQRKTPEGWEMTINRMRMIHGLTLSGQDIPIAENAMAELVKHLADTQGLAPQESAPFRYLIEQDLNQVEEDFDPELAIMCGRCHSSARFALQRRTEGEWEKLVHFHLGQYPSIEYSLYGRDRDWFAQALNDVVPQLATEFPFESEAWTRWQKAEKPALVGRWMVSGHMAGRGQMVGEMQVEQNGTDNYTLTLEGGFSDGQGFSSAALFGHWKPVKRGCHGGCDPRRVDQDRRR
jgi:quinohemoprotein amine dehydrogenase